MISNILSIEISLKPLMGQLNQGPLKNRPQIPSYGSCLYPQKVITQGSLLISKILALSTSSAAILASPNVLMFTCAIPVTKILTVFPTSWYV